MKQQFFSSDLFLHIIRVCTVLIGMCFMGDGCKDSVSPQEAVNTYAGKWDFSWTNVSMDTAYVHKVWLIFNRDSTFSSNAAFFIRRDSLSGSPCTGKWKIVMQNNDSFTDGTKPNKLELTSGNLSKSWNIDGQASAGYMDWTSSVIQYTWILSK
jgi:hypothetical protein